MRKTETALRWERDKEKALDAAGDAKGLQESQRKQAALKGHYEKVSAASGMKTDYTRAQASGNATLTTDAYSGILSMQGAKFGTYTDINDPEHLARDAVGSKEARRMTIYEIEKIENDRIYYMCYPEGDKNDIGIISFDMNYENRRFERKPKGYEVKYLAHAANAIKTRKDAKGTVAWF